VEHENTIQEIDLKNNIVVNRRSFFGALLCVGAAGMSAILAVPVLRFVLYPLYAKSSKGTWSPIGEMGAFSNLSNPILTPLDLKQVDGWREVDSSQTVYVTKNPQGALGVLSSICPHMGALLPIARVKMTSIARATEVYSRRTERMFRGLHRAAWTRFLTRLRTVSSWSSSSISGRTLPTRKC
jgi:hypothetical protein